MPNRLSTAWCVVLLMAGCASRSGQPSAAPGVAAAGPAFAARVAPASPEPALLQPVAMVDLKGVTIEQAIGSLAAQTGANLFVSWQVLEEAGVSRDTPVSARLTGVPLGKVLDLLLADAGGGDGKLGYRVDGEVVRISTTVDLNRSAHLQRERARRAADAEVRELLERVVPEVAMKDVPVRQALERLARDAGLRLRADWRTLAVQGVKTDEPISLTLREVTVDEALAAVMEAAEAANESEGGPRLQPVVYRGRLVLVTSDDGFRETRTIDVRDFLRPDEASRESDVAPPAPGARREDDGPTAREPSVDGYPLAKLIQEIVAPDSWRDNGGSIGALALLDGPLSGVFVVTQTYENLDEVELLLATLRGHLPFRGQD